MNEFLQATLPADAQQATLVGRVWVEGQGPVLVHVRGDALHDLSRLAPTSSALLELADPAAAVRAHEAPRIASLRDVIANSAADARKPGTPWLLAHAWPDAELVIVDEAAHETATSGMAEALLGATARFA